MTKNGRLLCAVCKKPIPIAKLGKIPSYIDGKEIRQFCSRKCRREYVEEKLKLLK